jgi:serine protease AprX
VNPSDHPRESRSNALWGARGNDRANALWGRRGERANALWGRTGRSAVFMVAAVLTVAIPLGANAGSGATPAVAKGTFVSPQLLSMAQQYPNQKLHLIIQSKAGATDAASKLRAVGGTVRKQLNLIGAAAVDVPAGKLNALVKVAGLTITADAPIRLSGSTTSAPSSDQMWPYESGDAKLWGSTGTVPTIAIVDSGIDANRADFDFGARVLPQVTLTSRTPNSPGDGRGHGTFVASVAAGSAPHYAGAAPTARILPIDVMDDTGTALTSDVIAACDYILQNKTALNIKVANFSLHSGARNHFYNDPLDKAVEKLWFNGVFVVAAAGNYGNPNGPSGVPYAPGNDPFVMTVGAYDLGGTVGIGNDAAAPWSAYGYTEDGFAKPELGAPGRYIVGAVPTSATLTTERPDHVVSPGYMELSGTSFAAPVVAGTAAQLLAAHPTWTPDQLKGVLMLSARPAPNTPKGSIGVGELNAAKAAAYAKTIPNPNASLESFMLPGNVFDATTWNAKVAANASWNTASWGDASWGDASWSAASWGDASWSAASWADASWADASWADASWADLSSEDAAEGDNSGPASEMDAAALAALESDPDLALPTTQVASDPSLSSLTTTP